MDNQKTADGLAGELAEERKINHDLRQSIWDRDETIRQLRAECEDVRAEYERLIAYLREIQEEYRGTLEAARGLMAAYREEMELQLAKMRGE